MTMLVISINKPQLPVIHSLIDVPNTMFLKYKPGNFIYCEVSHNSSQDSLKGHNHNVKSHAKRASLRAEFGYPDCIWHSFMLFIGSLPPLEFVFPCPFLNSWDRVFFMERLGPMQPVIRGSLSANSAAGA